MIAVMKIIKKPTHSNHPWGFTHLSACARLLAEWRFWAKNAPFPGTMISVIKLKDIDRQILSLQR
jgi:hypothetical protein